MFRLLFFSFFSFALSVAGASSPPPTVAAFLRDYCHDCHGSEKQKGDFRVDGLGMVKTAADAENWQMVLDSLRLGEMPPGKARQPVPTERERVMDWIAGELRQAARRLQGETGEVVLRRLNRTEYEHVIEDLFGLRGDFAEGFPEDANAEGFDNNGSALALSAEQLKQYLAAADWVLEQAIVTRARPETRSVRISLADFNRKIEENERRREEYFRKNPPTKQERERREAERKRGNHGHHYYPAWGADHLIPMKYMKPDTKDFFRVREPGWYRFRLTGYAVRNGADPVRLRVVHGSLSKEEVAEVAGVVQYEDATPKAAEFRVYLQPNHRVQLQMLDGMNWMWGSRIAEDRSPAVAVRSIEMEGPLIGRWPPAGHRNLLGERDATALKDEDMMPVFEALASRLFRRPMASGEVSGFLEFYRQMRSGGEPELEAFKETAKAMMVAPQFVYHVEPGGKPDSHAIANRLSFFLWRSVPDPALRGLADDGRLLEPKVLRTEVQRMLADERADRFVCDFADQWLGIGKVGEMQPDQNLYPEYDAELERAMVEETRGFLREMLHRDLSLTNLIDSDWAFLNDRLARHYGIKGVVGNHFRRVSLDRAKTVRGGLLTQASILNLTSNGTTTSPVVRGVWVLERLLGMTAPPPPPNAPAIEPDIRGASTIREQLARHRDAEACAACHRKIDPYGMALENFDVIGAWRERYRALETTANPNRPRLVEGRPVECADELPRGGSFGSFVEFRQLLAERAPWVYRNVATKLATFALGRAMTFADEPLLQGVVDRTRGGGGGLRTLIEELAASPLFVQP